MKLKRVTSPKRKTALTFAGVGLITLVQLLPATNSASAQTIQSERAQASAIVARLAYLGGQVSLLSEKYDQTQIKLTQANQQVSNTQNKIAQTQANINTIKSKLTNEAINVYVSGGNLPAFSALLSENPTQASIRQEYLNTVTSSQSDLIASFKSATQSLKLQQSQLKAAQAVAATAFNQVNSARSAAMVAVNQEQSQLNSVNSNIRALVAQQQQAAAAQRAASSAGQTTFSSPSNSSGSSHLPAINGSQVQIAIGWARRELGKPYVFGGAGPNAFDCSGLTSFVYAKAGVFLPHSAAAQYNDTTRIPLSALQPGDLVFYYSPISHVALYIGGGQVLQALNSSAPVEISGLYWDGSPVGAGRVS